MTRFFIQLKDILEISHSIAQIVGYSLSVIFFLLIIHFILKWKHLVRQRNSKFAEHFNITKSEESPEQKRWSGIKERFQSNNPSDWRVAILDADSMLEDLLIRLGYEGDTFAERLKSIPKEDFPWLQTAWDVHLVRNKIAHEGSNTYLNERDIQYIFRDYERIFVETGYLA